MLTTFKEAVSFLERYIPVAEKRHPGKLGLMRMKYLVSLLGNPHLAYQTVHVGGTSGKGSTATIVASILATKYKVGLITSPHLETICERIKTKKKWKMPACPLRRIEASRRGRENGEWKMPQRNLKVNNKSEDITEEEFVELANEITPYIYKVERSKYGRPSYFEIVTAMAFMYFKLQQVDYAVVEVGMGGRFDATNVIRPLVAVLTNVGLDHTEVLGETLEEIANDKVGIIKKGIQVVSGAKQPSVIDIIEATGKIQNAKISLLGRDFSYKIKKLDIHGSTFDYCGNSILRNLKVTMLGAHQVENAALAIRVVEKLNNIIAGPAARVSQSLDASRFGIPSLASPANIYQSLVQVFIPGRLEIVRHKPLIILDGAHNPDKVKVLTNAVKQIFPKKKVTLIIAIKQDKDAKAILKHLLPICQQVIFTEFKLTGDIGTISSYTGEELSHIARNLKVQLHSSYSQSEVVMKMSVIPNVYEAINQVMNEAGRSGLILVTGSLYLVGEIKQINCELNH